jgi:hypothetical protein
VANERDRNPHDDESSFRVIDRRLFTETGELRPDAVAREAAEERAEAATPAAPPAPAKQNPAGPATPAAEAPKPLRGFQQLISFLAQNAVAMLGGYPDPRTGQAYLDLAGARELLDMLEALREKSRGNLAAEEDRVLVEVIGSLKMSYLEAQQATAQAMREKAKGQP